jgi:hypothetical protein
VPGNPSRKTTQLFGLAVFMLAETKAGNVVLNPLESFKVTLNSRAAFANSDSINIERLQVGCR